MTILSSRNSDVRIRTLGKCHTVTEAVTQMLFCSLLKPLYTFITFVNDSFPFRSQMRDKLLQNLALVSTETKVVKNVQVDVSDQRVLKVGVNSDFER